MGATPATAAGVRGIAVAGDVTNSVIVTGDGVTVQLRVDGDDPLLAAARAPVSTPRARPVHQAPAPVPAPLGRDGEARRLLAETGAGRSIEVRGEPDVGKTLLVLHALATAARPVLPDGEIYVSAAGKELRDVLQDVLDAMVDTRPPVVLAEQALRRAVGDLRALVVVDGHELDRERARQLRQALPRCCVVLVARGAVLGEGTSVPVGGLAEAPALALLEEELGRPLGAAEREPARQLWAAVAGHPFRLRQAAAAVRDGRGDFGALAGGTGHGRSLTELLLDALEPQERAVVEQLAAVQGRTLGLEHLTALLGRDGLAERVDRLCRARLIASGSPRYRTAGATLAVAATEGARTRAARQLAAWARTAPPADVAAETPALDALLDAAVRDGRREEAIALARATAGAWAWSRRWGRWGTVLATVAGLARDTQDRSAEAWALHGLGTRAYGLGDATAGAELLTRALRLRETLGEHAAAAASRHNLEFIAGGPPGGHEGQPDDGPPDDGGPGPGRRLVAAGAALTAGLVVAVAAVGGDRPATEPITSERLDFPQPTTRATPPPTEPQPDRTTTTAQPVALDVEVDGDGRVTSRPEGLDCPERCEHRAPPGTEIVLVAQPGEGASFAGWAGDAGDGCASTATCRIVLERPTSIAAHFVPQEDPCTGGVDVFGQTVAPRDCRDPGPVIPPQLPEVAPVPAPEVVR